jgi:transposase
MNPDTDPTEAAWELPEGIWRHREPLLPPQPSQEGCPQSVDLTRLTEGIFSVLCTGSQGQACPCKRFGPPSTVYDYFRPWVAAGVFGALVGRGADR